MTQPLSLRLALNADAIPLQFIIKACFQQYAQQGIIFNLQELPDLIHPASSLPHNPPHEHASLFVASLGHRIVASLCTHVTHNSCKHSSCEHSSCEHSSCEHGTCKHGTCEHSSCEITRFYVHPLFQGQKIGSHILHTLLPSLSHHTLFLWTDTRFTKAHHIYTQLGFKNDGTPPRILNDLSKSKELYFVAPPHSLTLPR